MCVAVRQMCTFAGITLTHASDAADIARRFLGLFYSPTKRIRQSDLPRRHFPPLQIFLIFTTLKTIWCTYSMVMVTVNCVETFVVKVVVRGSHNLSNINYNLRY